MKIFFAIILLAAAFSLFFFWSQPMRSDIRELEIEKQNFESVIARINVLRKSRDSLLQSYNTIPDEELKKIKNAVPETAKSGVLVVQLANMTSQNNLLLKNINVAEPKTAAKQKNEKNKENKDNIISLTFSVSGSYRNFINFIEELEKSLRIIDITDVSFSSGGDKDLYDFSLTVNSYILGIK
jgi:Tfp pilus assembly protein PilO